MDTPCWKDPAWLYEHYVRFGLSGHKCAQIAGCRFQLVYASLERFGFPRRSVGGRDTHQCADKYRIKSEPAACLHCGGVFVVAPSHGQQFCCHQCYVHYYNERRTPPISREELECKYVREQKSAKECAADLSVGTTTVYRCLRRYDLPIRGQSEAQALKFTRNESRRRRMIDALAIGRAKVDHREVGRRNWRGANRDKQMRIRATPEHRAKMRRVAQERVRDPKWQERHRQALERRFDTPEKRAYHSECLRAAQRRKGNRITRPCVVCGKSIERKRSQFRGRPCCSQVCKGRLFAEASRGEKHWNWKGGVGGSRAEWLRNGGRRWRQRVISAARGICQLCGQKPEAFDVHHKASFDEYPEYRSVLENGVALCVSCHRGYVHSKAGRTTREAWESDFLMLMGRAA